MFTFTHPSLPSPVVARLIPQNTHTRQALDDLQASDAVLDHYKAYVRCQAPPDRDPAAPQPGKSDSLKDLVAENDESTEDESFSPPSFDGRYGCIELNFGRVSQKLPGWRLGGGGSKTSNTNPKVDVLIIQYEQRRNMGVARFHALIHFHKASGVLMLTAVSERFPVIYFLDNEPLQLSSGESHVLFQRSNRFQLGKLEFLLRYEDMDATTYATWVSARNALLATHDLPAPCKDIMALPWRQNFDRLWDFILYETVGTGTFGWVKASVDRRTGHPYAVKQLDLKHSSERRACNEEVKISVQLQVRESFFCLAIIIDICFRVFRVFWSFIMLFVTMDNARAVGPKSDSTWFTLSHRTVTSQNKTGRQAMIFRRLRHCFADHYKASRPYTLEASSIAISPGRTFLSSP